MLEQLRTRLYQLGYRVGKYLLKTRSLVLSYLPLGIGIVGLQILYISSRFEYLSDRIPLFYSLEWGDYQLTAKQNLYILPLLGLAVVLLGLLLRLWLHKFYVLYSRVVLNFTVFGFLAFMSLSIYRIVQIASVPFEPIIAPTVLGLVPAFVVSFALTYYVMPTFIDFAFSQGLVTNPQLHLHPGMALKSPSARGGGVVYTVIFVFLSLLFTNFDGRFTGIYIAALMMAVLGFLDDFQNTHINSSFKFLENPILRLFMLFCVASVIVISGIGFSVFTNPFGGVVSLTNYLPQILTGLWIVWFLNALSWSNGLDAQYGGIVGIASIMLAFLALRFDFLENFHLNLATLSIISAGIALGFIKYTWHPSKIMWGFGAMCAGIVIASLSILVQAKLFTTILLVLIPFIDAVITFVRRLLQRKNPLRGDRGHLHHLLLNRGWSVRRVALFYWFASAVFGVIGILTADNNNFTVGLILAVFTMLFILYLNIREFLWPRISKPQS